MLIFVSGLLISCGGGDPTTTSNNDGYVKVTFELVNLPVQLEVNKSTTNDSAVEYWWSAIFDINDDAIVNEGDIELVLSHTKFTGSLTEMSTLSTMQANLSKIVDSNIRYGSMYIGLIEVSTLGNTIILSASKNKYPSDLSGITMSTRVYFKTLSVDDTGSQHWDYLPSEDTYLEMTTDGKFMDEPGDVNSDTSLQHVDLIAAEVSIN